MRRSTRWRLIAPAPWLAALGLLVLTGADGDKSALTVKKPIEPPLKLKGEETVGDVADIRSNGEVRVEGVGLVVDLDDTGSDPPPSPYRAKLLDEMRKAGVPEADRWLSSKKTALVLVSGRIPTGVTPRDVFDAEVAVTPADTATSLAGGRLLLTRLHIQGVTKDGVLEGQVMATAFGPILPGSAQDVNDLRSGRILGAARVKKELPFGVILRDNRRGFKAAKLVEDAINMRFHMREAVEQKGAAEAKSDQVLTLKVPEVYHQNQVRYFQVVNLLPIVDNPTLRAARLERWGKELVDRKQSGVAALRLEGIGRNAIGILKTGLASPDPQVRFFAAEALAYLNDDSGVAELTKAAKATPDFRANALAALAAMDLAPAVAALRSMLAEPEIALRVGAFEALRAVDSNDPMLNRVPLLRFEPEPEPEDAMALEIARPRRRAPRPDDPFDLYVVRCDGPPLVHVSRTRRREVVLFGAGQRLLTPVVLGDGGHLLLNAADGDREVQISRIATGRPDLPDRRVACPLSLQEVITEVVNLGASYPEVLTILQAADKQRNLAAPLVVDARPESTGTYDKAQLTGEVKTDAAVGRAGFDGEGKAPRRRLIDRLFRRP